MSQDPRNRPVVIGVHQLINREKDPAKAPGPLDMLIEIARGAAQDSGAGESALEVVDALGLVEVAGWYPQSATGLICEKLGIAPKTRLQTRVGGELSLTLVNRIAESIARGEVRAGLILGTNNLATGMKARAAGVDPGWETGGEGEPELMGATKPGNSELEEAYGIDAPTNVYPIIENALRARRGRDLESHSRALSDLMEPFTRVAAANPYAWFPVARSAEEIRTVTDQNRMIAFPYPKYMNAVLYTDQAAGALICSEETAQALGVPREKWVYWWGGANTAEKSWFVSERTDIGRSHALDECARRTFANTGLSIDDIQHIDFYSCFPVAVELGCEAYGVAEDDPRGLTVTGGLPYAGGPGNNYPMHSLVTMIERLRANVGDKGMVTGNGWYVTKHSSSVFSTEPNPDEPKGSWPEPAEVGTDPEPVATEANGEAVVEGYTVLYGRDGRPERGIVLGRLNASGERFIANTTDDPAALEDLAAHEAIGRIGRVEHVGGLNRMHLAPGA